MSKRGFNTNTVSKSAEARSNKTDDPNAEPSSPLSPPQGNGQRKRLTDLKIDFNFVPNAKNNTTSKVKTTTTTGQKKVTNGISPLAGSKTPQPKIRGNVNSHRSQANGSNNNK